MDKKILSLRGRKKIFPIFLHGSQVKNTFPLNIYLSDRKCKKRRKVKIPLSYKKNDITFLCNLRLRFVLWGQTILLKSVSWLLFKPF